MVNLLAEKAFQIVNTPPAMTHIRLRKGIRFSPCGASVHGTLAGDAEFVPANGVRDVARRKVRIVLFRHPRAGVAQLFGNDAHRHAAHDERRAMCMPKHVE
jgi:hypothetical protein